MNSIQIDWKKLKQVCLAKESALIPEGSNYYFKDNGSKILAIAHCDYVCTGQPDFVTYKYKDDMYVQSETLDDRLGVYIITELLPSLGIVTDILLTTDEEIGRTTASAFETNKKYNWIFSFDRKGTDIVAYDYDDATLKAQVLEGTGVKLAWGTFSDISSLEHLNVKGLNFGTGYHNEHTSGCYATQREITTGISQFIRWYKLYKDIHLPHTPVPATSYGKGDESWRRKDHWWKDDYYWDYRAWDDGYSGRFNYVYRDGKPVEVTEEEEDIEEGEIIAKGHCDYCDEYDNLIYSQFWGGLLCPECLDRLSEGNEDPHNPVTSERCQLCGITEADSDLEEVILYDGREVLLCTMCADSIYEHEKDRDYIDKLQFVY